MKFSEAVDAFLFHCSVERRLSENTVNAYRADLRDLAKFLDADMQIVELNVDRLRDYLSDLTVRRGLSSGTARRRIACQRSFWRYTASNCTAVDPFGSWSPSIKRSKRLPKALHTPEVSDLVKATRNGVQACKWSADIRKSTRLAVWIMLVTGVRVSELCAIRTTDISPDGVSIRIGGKGGRDRQVYVVDPDLRNEITSERLQRSETPSSDSYFFLNSRGRPLSPQTLRQRLHKLTALADLDRRITPHMLRHTAATKLIEEGVDIRFVQRLLGHASIATTEIYTHVTDDSLKKALNQANAWSDLMSA